MTFIEQLKTKGIQTVFHYVPLHSAPMGRQAGRAVGDMSNTASLSDRLVRLPLWLGLEDQLAFVIQEVISAAS
jgi:dTDP-4-amino-4,6-dideoxygalactose transaminase